MANVPHGPREKSLIEPADIWEWLMVIADKLGELGLGPTEGMATRNQEATPQMRALRLAEDLQRALVCVGPWYMTISQITGRSWNPSFFLNPQVGVLAKILDGPMKDMELPITCHTPKEFLEIGEHIRKANKAKRIRDHELCEADAQTFWLHPETLRNWLQQEALGIAFWGYLVKSALPNGGYILKPTTPKEEDEQANEEEKESEPREPSGAAG